MTPTLRPISGPTHRTNARVGRAAFTLIELLVVIAIIALLTGILLPSLGAARESGRRVVCASNQRMIVLAGTMYAYDHPREVFVPNESSGEDNLGYLAPDYITQPELAVCPSTDNFVDPAVILDVDNNRNKYGRPVPLHLTESALNAWDRGDGEINFSFNGGGHSFEVWSWRNSWQGSGRNGGWTVFPTGWYDRSMGTVDRNVQRGLKPSDPAYLPASDDQQRGRNGQIKSMRTVEFASKVLLTIDSDQDHTTTQQLKFPGALNNWPEEHNNHKDAGVNIGFTDGHVEWVAKGPGLIEVYLNSGSMGASGIRERITELHPGLTKEVTRIGRNNWTRWSY